MNRREFFKSSLLGFTIGIGSIIFPARKNEYTSKSFSISRNIQFYKDIDSVTGKEIIENTIRNGIRYYHSSELIVTRNMGSI